MDLSGQEVVEVETVWITERNWRTRGIVAFLGLAVLGISGCAREPARENVRHRLFVSDYAPEESGKCYVVLRYDDLWRSARHSRRVGLIKFRTYPEPTLIDHRWVWGKPVGEERFVLFDAMENRIIRNTDYVERKPLEEDHVLAFTDGSDRLEVVRPDGRVVVSEEAGFTDMQLARGEKAQPVLELRRGDEVLRVTLEGETVPSLDAGHLTGIYTGTDTAGVAD